MKYPRTAAGYAEYIKSDHWDMLRSCVLERDGHCCVRCGSGVWLQAHHKFYRADWEEAQPGDLITPCKACHEKEHPEKHTQVTVTVSVRIVPDPQPETPFFGSRKSVEEERSKGLITRSEFIIQRQRLLNLGQWGGGKQKKRNRKYGRPSRPKVRHRQPCKPWYYNPPRPKWVNRDRSSN